MSSITAKVLGGNLRPSSASSTLSSRHLLGSLLGGVNNKVVYIIVLHLSIKLHYISIHHVIILLPHLAIFLPYITRQLGQYFTNKQINIIKSNIKKYICFKNKMKVGLSLLALSEGSHFRGGTFQFTPTGNKLTIGNTQTWRSTFSGYKPQCTKDDVTNQIPADSKWTQDAKCSLLD